jgi:hypothetical protein
MKRLNLRLATLLLALLALPVLLSFVKPKKSVFNGVWQFTEGFINDGERGFPNMVEIKVFNNGKFDGYNMTSRSSAKTMNGTFKILNDSVYTETLIQASNNAMIGQTYVINYILRGNTMLASGFYDVLNNGVIIKVNYHQTWKRVDYRPND